MSDPIIYGSLDKKLQSLGIYGFSGNNLLDSSKVTEYLSATIENDFWKAFLYYKLAETGYHLPQDSLGIAFDRDQILFAIADGVSIIGGTHENSSGDVALNLIKSALNNIPNRFNEIGKHYLKKRLRGASTLQSGQVTHLGLTTRFFGEPKNLGSSYYVDKNGTVTDFTTDSEDFFPQSVNAALQTINNYEISKVLVTSDGAKLDEEQARTILNLTDNKQSGEELAKVAISILPTSPDDQSLILIKRK